MKVSLDGKRAFISAGGAGMGRSTAIPKFLPVILTMLRSRPCQLG
jgi:hypothetical protein